MDSNGEILKLKEDLIAKSNHFASLLGHPRLYISEYFYSVRNEIDFAIERLLSQNALGSALEIEERNAALNSSRSQMLRELGAHESRLLERVASKELGKQIIKFQDTCKLIDQKIGDHFSEKASNLYELEDFYEKLAVEILDHTYRLEKVLMSDQTFLFLETNSMEDERLPGALIHLADSYLDPAETKCLKTLASKTRLYNQGLLHEIHEFLEKNRNELFCIYVRKPFILTKNMFLIAGLAGSMADLPSIIYHFDKNSLRTKQTYYKIASEFQSGLSTLANELSNLSIESVDEDSFEYFGSQTSTLSLTQNKFQRLHIGSTSFVEHLTDVGLTSNRLVEFNQDLFKSFKKIDTLELVDSFNLEVDFNLNFLKNYTNLTTLILTLPNIPFDLRIFQSFDKLDYLELRSATTRDSTLPRPKLNRESFDILASRMTLEKLLLCGFETDTTDLDKFPRFISLQELSITNDRITSISSTLFDNISTAMKRVVLQSNIISHIGENSFSKFSKITDLFLGHNSIAKLDEKSFYGLSNLYSLELNNNLIEDLPSGVFDPLKNLLTLNLKANKMKHIQAGQFKKLKKLMCLYLDENLIETIEANSFSALENLVSLHMSKCRLKCIDGQMLEGLGSLNVINVSDNQIHSIIVKVDHLSEPITLGKDKLSGEQLNIIKEKMFPSCKKLNSFNLTNNNIEELDLSCFCNLQDLRQLLVSNNKIKAIRTSSSKMVPTSMNLLDISNNNLKGFDADFLRPFTKLSRLFLQNNQLELTIDAETFSPEARLSEINLLGNKAVRFHPGAWTRLNQVDRIHYECADDKTTFGFKNWNKIRRVTIQKSSQAAIEHLLVSGELSIKDYCHLNFSQNSIQSLDLMEFNKRFAKICSITLKGNVLDSLNSSWFVGIDNLITLDLSNNLLTSLNDPNVFGTKKYLKNLDLSGNKLVHMHRAIFSGLSGISVLNLANNCLEVVDDTLFKNLIHLEQLSLKGNKIKHLNAKRLFRNTRLLKSLDLSENHLDNKSINQFTDSHLELQHELRKLNLGNNQLDSLDFIRGFSELRELNLSRNKISSLSDNKGCNLFSRLLLLTELDLSHNQIRNFKLNQFEHLVNSLDRVDISGNLIESSETDKLRKQLEASEQRNVHLKLE